MRTEHFKDIVEYELVGFWQFKITILSLLGIVFIIGISQLLVLGTKTLILQQRRVGRLDEEQSRILQIYTKYIINFITLLISLNLTGIHIKELLEFHIIDLNNMKLTPYHFLGIILIFFIARFLLWTFKKVIIQQEKSNVIDIGKGFAIYKITKYIIIVITASLVLETLGIKITILLAGSAALLVGLGLGIQQIFNDVVSGIFLLFEGTVSVHDIVEIDSLVGEVKNIDIRTSKIKTRDNVMIIVPNSKLISDNVINWTLNKEATRFKVEVGVAYGSDTGLVHDVLLEVALNHPDITEAFKPYVRFDNFGNSSLDFTLLFWSTRMFEEEELKSEIRFEIDRRFREEKITIPFPQRDLHLKSNDTTFTIKTN